jgi:hypothetical protein
MAQIGPACSHPDPRFKLLFQKFIPAAFLIFVALFLFPAFAGAQQQSSSSIQYYGGYSWLSNSFNGVPGSRKALNGGYGGVVFSPWHHLSFKLDYSMYRGTNLDAPQHAFFILGGGQYGTTIHRERIFAEALFGEGGLNSTWFNPDPAGYKHGNTGTLASFAEFLGGGIDTPVSRHFAIRAEGGVQHSGFSPIEPDSKGSVPYHLDGLPNYFGRFSVGMVWLPHLGSAVRPAPSQRTPVESELIFQGLSSVGHFHIFANSWWSYLSTGGVEYDRHSWGKLGGARVDYSAEFLPLIILRQPTKTDVFGYPIGAGRTQREVVPGVGILPIGMRLIWREGKRVKPYYVIKGGMTGYSKKAFSQDAAYENFCLDQSTGLQIRLNDRIDFRAGVGVFHQSDGFVVPSNPGLDEMVYSGGISYHLGHARAAK